VTAVSARTSESAERRAGITHAYDDPQALVDDPGVELVSS
jgi:predicted dehydrogenase